MSTQFKTIKQGQKTYWLWVGVLGLIALVGYGAAHHMETEGHWVSGMNNQVVWGLPHVFAIFLILAASGALNIASLSSVFTKLEYKPWARLSALLAICLLIGGLVILVLDLGRPERLIVAMTHYNFKSIFAWNIFLYTGFVLVAVVYLCTMFERSLNKWTPASGLFAFIWRFVLTAGTGSIFGFIVARQFFDAAIMVPIFIVLSLIVGKAMFILTSLVVTRLGGSYISLSLLNRLIKLLGLFVAAELFLVAVFHFTNLYATEHHGVEHFILLSGGGYTLLFWIGQMIAGGFLPLYLIFGAKREINLARIILVCCLVVIGALSQLYVTIIGGQAYPQVLFPGKDVSSTFYDGVVAHYSPALPELLLGLGGISLSLLLVFFAIRILPFLPDQRFTSQSTS